MNEKNMSLDEMPILLRREVEARILKPFLEIMEKEMGEEKTKKIIATIPLGRGAQPREIANMVLFYASDLASFATGEISDVDGGVTMDG